MESELIKAEKVTVTIMNIIIYSALVLMFVGLIFFVAGINEASAPDQRATIAQLLASVTQPDSAFFFGMAVIILLITPLCVSFANTIVFILNGEIKMAFAACLLFTILMISIAIRI